VQFICSSFFIAFLYPLPPVTYPPSNCDRRGMTIEEPEDLAVVQEEDPSGAVGLHGKLEGFW
jgi:hypothetical protein